MMNRLRLFFLIALALIGQSAFAIGPSTVAGKPYGGGFELDFIGAPQFQFNNLINFTRASTATYFDKTGTMVTAAADTPRFDYDPVTLKPKGFLIEGARTNLILYRRLEGGTAGTVGVDAVAPTGWFLPVSAGGTLSYPTTQYGMLGVLASSAVSTERPIISQSGLSVSANTTYTFSSKVFSLSGTVPTIQQAIYTPTVPSGATVTYAVNNTVVASSYNGYSVGDVLSVVVSVGATSGTITVRLGYNVLSSGTVGSIGLTVPQLEAGGFASSWIDNATQSASATRAADVATITNLSRIGFNASEGTMLAEFMTIGENSGGAIYTFGSPGFNSIELRRGVGVPTQLISLVTVSSINQAGLTSTGVVSGITYKHAFGWRTNDFSASLNGGSVITDTSGSLPSVTDLKIGRGTSELFGYLRRLVYFPYRLPDATLQNMSAL